MTATMVDYARTAFDLIDEFERATTTGQVMGLLGSALSAFGYIAFVTDSDTPLDIRLHVSYKLQISLIEGRHR